MLANVRAWLVEANEFVVVSLDEHLHITPLHLACSFGQLAVVKYLVEHHPACLTDTDDRGWTTAWFYACGQKPR